MRRTWGSLGAVALLTSLTLCAGTLAGPAVPDASSHASAAPAPPTTEAQLRADLMSTSPEYDTIDLPAGQTIVIAQPLEITHSVKIVGNGATTDVYYDPYRCGKSIQADIVKVTEP